MTTLSWIGVGLSALCLLLGIAVSIKASLGLHVQLMVSAMRQVCFLCLLVSSSDIVLLHSVLATADFRSMPSLLCLRIISTPLLISVQQTITCVPRRMVVQLSLLGVILVPLFAYRLVSVAE
jgi:hypothetical protein